jgi:nucleotide-binding universal stress UspA family protein
VTADGPVIVGFDGSPAAERALRGVAGLLPGRRVLVVTVWEPGAAYALVEPPVLAPAPIDVRVAQEVDDALYEQARQLAQHGAEKAATLGLEATSLAVADELSVAETLVRVADERGAAAIAVGAHGHGRVRELVLGSTSGAVVRKATCPVLVVRDE